MTDLMPGNDGEIGKHHMRPVSSCEHFSSLLSQVTFVVLPNEVFKLGKVNVHLFFYKFLLDTSCV